MDHLEQKEINSLITRYQCQKDSQIILDNLCASGRINKAQLNRKGFNNKNINAIVTRLKLALQSYKE